MNDLNNFYRDPRTAARPALAPVLHVEEEIDGEYVESIELPYRWIVCHLCDGSGTHVNPSIDAGGLSAEDFAEDPDFAEDYARGVYDEPCRLCRGRTTIPVVDEDRCDPELLARYRQQKDEILRDREIELAELAMGA